MATATPLPVLNLAIIASPQSYLPLKHYQDSITELGEQTTSKVNLTIEVFQYPDFNPGQTQQYSCPGGHVNPICVEFDKLFSGEGRPLKVEEKIKLYNPETEDLNLRVSVIKTDETPTLKKVRVVKSAKIYGLQRSKITNDEVYMTLKLRAEERPETDSWGWSLIEFRSQDFGGKLSIQTRFKEVSQDEFQAFGQPRNLVLPHQLFLILSLAPLVERLENNQRQVAFDFLPFI